MLSLDVAIHISELATLANDACGLAAIQTAEGLGAGKEEAKGPFP